MAPPSQAFRDYRAARTGSRATLPAAGPTFGYMPPPAPPIAPQEVTSVLFAPPARYTAPVATLLADPATFDLRTLNKLTAVRNQGSFGTCWTFATMASLESALLPGQTADFSEHNLANLSLFSQGYNGGGNAAMSTAYLTRWSGPVSEADDPYPKSAPWPASPADLPMRAHVQNVDFLPERSGPTDNATLKWAMETYGAVFTSMEWLGTAYRSSTASFYYPPSTTSDNIANHAVTLVGWDDNYAAGNFTATPPGNGAFLVRNSWGSSWGKSGYFWLSYYDSVCPTGSVAFYGAEPTNNYTRIYQNDPMGWTSDFGYGNPTAWFANAFTAEYTGTVNAIGFYTSTADATYEVRVATTVGGIAAATTVATGTVHVPGFHTVTVTTPAAISAGAQFVVAVKLTEAGSRWPVAVESPLSNYADATASSGQSYVSASGNSWSDLTSLHANANVCLKAYVDDSGPPDQTPPPNPSPAPTATTPAISSVTSPTDPDPARWYATRTVQVQWQASADATQYSWSLDHSPVATTDTTAEGSVASASFTGVADGVWYFHVRAGGAAGWGTAATVRMQVDATGPRTTALSPSSLRRHAVSTLRFRVADTVSPTARVTIGVYRGAKLVKTLAAGSRATGKVQSLKWRCLLPRGRYVLRVFATDLAGNAQTALGHRVVRVR
jgi:C1A family cysteine protease